VPDLFGAQTRDAAQREIEILRTFKAFPKSADLAQ
jgi:hypothetical protein